jgi:hypothetical protein
MMRKLTFAAVILCFAVVHAIALHRLDRIRHQDASTSAVVMPTGD